MTFNDKSIAREIVRWGLEHYPNLLITSGFNLNGVVLIDIAVRAGYRGEVVFVDTGSHFPETLQTRDAIAEQYPAVLVVTLRADAEAAKIRCGSEDCCANRKVAPLRRYMSAYRPDALLNARSRFQASTRRDLSAVDASGEYPKINPLAYWERSDLEAYAIDHRLPVNPLYWQGFLSIGCAPVTRKVERGESVRAGRWEGQPKTECGLWFGDQAL
ncbi:MAG: phosphoadenylyl-sulfate reductase [Trueperaceae bacterium]|nr:phosphoadenylyl-sulfate reductase [Trueperaceae bacterium]